MTSFGSTKNIFQKILDVNDDFQPKHSFRFASGEEIDHFSYSKLNSLPQLKTRVVAAVEQCKKECIGNKKSQDYFDEYRWINHFTNQIHQINRCSGEPYADILIKEADDMLYHLHSFYNPEN